ncbi:MAG: Fic/DOC family protein [Candidatus Moraniibacteriota bacterium]|nr:MAG: Fic/DOC family protein [Candidatus Moranbacteria bacterium]
MKKLSNKGVAIYQAKSGAIELKGDFTRETLWATQAQIAGAFDVDVRTINEHIKNIYKSDELSEKSTIRKFRIVQKEGKREIEREINHYNLDLILSVGYRVNSKRATQFRQWATKTLRAHIVDGYTINCTRVGKNYDAFMKAVADVRALLPAGMQGDTGSILELVRMFADTWMSLDAYDKEALDIRKPTKKKVALTGAKLAESVAVLKNELIHKGEATDLFATERNRNALEGIVGNVMQAFAGVDVYPSVESKAAHLLYFIVKNHPFIDGNKRTGAYSFVWFLSRAKVLDTRRLTPEALTALTLLIAESNPRDKDKLIGLVMMLISKK